MFTKDRELSELSGGFESLSRRTTSWECSDYVVLGIEAGNRKGGQEGALGSQEEGKREIRQGKNIQVK